MSPWWAKLIPGVEGYDGWPRCWVAITAPQTVLNNGVVKKDKRMTMRSMIMLWWVGIVPPTYYCSSQITAEVKKHKIVPYLLIL